MMFGDKVARWVVTNRYVLTCTIFRSVALLLIEVGWCATKLKCAIEQVGVYWWFVACISWCHCVCINGIGQFIGRILLNFCGCVVGASVLVMQSGVVD